MEKIEIDIALLLPERMNRICREINKQVSADAQSDLSKTDNYPHITLAMGVVEETSLPKIIAKVQNVSRNAHTIPITVLGAETKKIRTGKTSYEFQVQKSSHLLDLHAVMMRSLSPFLCDDATDALFHIDEDETLHEVTAYWVENYARHHSNPKTYDPHISLKCANGDYTGFPLHFSVSQIAVCRLGNYCTCRKSFAVIDLPPLQ